jgi:hypothetical protein
MAKIKKLKTDENFPISLSIKERDLILDCLVIDDNLVKPIKIALLEKNKITFQYTLYELEALLEYIAAEANHAEDDKLEQKLDKLYD